MSRNAIDRYKDYLAYHINSINFNDSELTYQKLIKDSEKWHQELRNSRKIGSKGRLGEKVITFKNGWFWVKLDRKSCEMEGGSMGHCGNAGGNHNDKIFSLRDPGNVPYLTFIVNNGILGESKGRFNKKPERKFHPYIFHLLLSDHIRHVNGGGYAPHNNFEEKDLSNSMRKSLYALKPQLFDTIEFYLQNQSQYLSYEDSVKILTDKRLLPKQNSEDYYNYEYNTKHKKLINPYTNTKGLQKKNDKELQKLIQIAEKTVENTPYAYLVELKNTNKLSTKSLEKIKEELSVIIYHGDEDPLLQFIDLIIECRHNYPKYYSKIYNFLNPYQKSDLISYFISIDLPLHRSEYYDLSHEHLTQIVDMMKKQKLPIPDELKAALDLSNDPPIGIGETDFNLRDPYQVEMFLDEIVTSIRQNKKVDENQKKLFNKISLLEFDILSYIKDFINDQYESNKAILTVIYPLYHQTSYKGYYGSYSSLYYIKLLNFIFSQNLPLTNEFKNWAKKLAVYANRVGGLPDRMVLELGELNSKLGIGGSDVIYQYPKKRTQW